MERARQVQQEEGFFDTNHGCSVKIPNQNVHVNFSTKYPVALRVSGHRYHHHHQRVGLQTSFGQQPFFPKAAAKGSFEKSVAIKDCHQSSAEVMAVFKDCNQTLPKVLLE